MVILCFDFPHKIDTVEVLGAKSYAIEFQTESFLALNKKVKVNWNF